MAEKVKETLARIVKGTPKTAAEVEERAAKVKAIVEQSRASSRRPGVSTAR